MSSSRAVPLLPCVKQNHVDVILDQRGNESEINDYTTDEELENMLKVRGRAQVKLYRHPKTKELVVLKRFNKDRRVKNGKFDGYDMKEMDAKEMELNARLLHPNIVRTLVAINDPQWANMFLVMEYMSKGQIMNFDDKKGCYYPHPDFGNKSKMSTSMTVSVMRDCLLALQYLHEVVSPRVIHRDIKPSNILINAFNQAKLSDFGISEEFTEDEIALNGNRAMIQSVDAAKGGGLIGTLWFLPKEYFTQKEFEGRKADMWAMGIVLFIMLSGKPPLMETNQQKFSEKIKKLRYGAGKGRFSLANPRATNAAGKKGGKPVVRPQEALTQILEALLNRDEPDQRPFASLLLQDPLFSQYLDDSTDLSPKALLPSPTDI